MSSGKIITGLLAGVAIGAILGLLFAPVKGSDTRKKISKRGEKLADDIKGKFSDFFQNISDKLDEVKDEVKTVKGKVEKVKG